MRGKAHGTNEPLGLRSELYGLVGCLAGLVLFVFSACDATREESGEHANGAVQPNRVEQVNVPPEALYLTAMSRPMPVYPGSSLQKGVGGVAVASVLVGPDGRVKEVSILESPDTEIGEALHAAVMEWTYHPVFHRGSPVRFRGTLILYFEVSGTTGRVLTPDYEIRADDPGVGKESPMRQVDEAELQRLLSDDDVALVDIRDRNALRLGHRGDSLNIPIGELFLRARMELPQSKLIIVNCSGIEVSRCSFAGSMLQRAGFSRFALFIP